MNKMCVSVHACLFQNEGELSRGSKFGKGRWFWAGWIPVYFRRPNSTGYLFPTCWQEYLDVAQSCLSAQGTSALSCARYHLYGPREEMHEGLVIAELGISPSICQVQRLDYQISSLKNNITPLRIVLELRLNHLLINFGPKEKITAHMQKNIQKSDSDICPNRVNF